MVKTRLLECDASRVLYSAGQISVVKGCVSRCLNHAIFYHVLWPADRIKTQLVFFWTIFEPFLMLAVYLLKQFIQVSFSIDSLAVFWVNC